MTKLILAVGIIIFSLSNNSYAQSKTPYSQEEFFERTITETIDLGLIGVDLGPGDDVLWLGSSEDPDSGRVDKAINGGNGFDTLVLENVASWSALSDLERVNIVNFELIIFSEAGGRQACKWNECDN